MKYRSRRRVKFQGKEPELLPLPSSPFAGSLIQPMPLQTSKRYLQWRLPKQAAKREGLKFWRANELPG
jgi:hypothetical protein